MEDKGNGGNTVLLTVIGIATLLVAIVGATFAYFTATVTDGDKGSSIIIQTATLAIIYNDGNEVVASGITPGWSAVKTVTIENPTGYAADYNFGWAAGAKNTLELDELVYDFSCTTAFSDGFDESGGWTLGANPTGFTGRPVPGNAGGTALAETLIPSGTINAHNIITCTLRFEFVETNSVQNYNQTKEFAGKLELKAEAMSAQGV